MPDFKKFMMRHGEHSVQFIVEQIEKAEGIKRDALVLLEDRWEALKIAAANDQEMVSE